MIQIGNIPVPPTNPLDSTSVAMCTPIGPLAMKHSAMLLNGLRSFAKMVESAKYPV